MKTAHRLCSMACAALLTLTILSGIDLLARSEASAGAELAAVAAARG
jgi:hypothetical protein